MTDPTLQLLIIDDERSYRRVLQQELQRRGIDVRVAPDAEEGARALLEEVPDVILLDLKMPGMGGIAFLQKIRAQSCSSEVIILTGNPDLESAVEALRLGAHDYLSKPVDLGMLEAVVRRAGELRQLRRENGALRHALVPQRATTGLRSNSPAMQQLLQSLPRIAESESTVLILGETGTGKEVIAREVHRLSRRSAEPLVVVDCGALQSSVKGSELFGHEKGAFTGADSARPGLFEAAHRGTVFLDEIGELDPDAQASLLRVLENSEIRRLGATRSRRLDVRVLAATNRDLNAEVAAGRFREDLMYRLQVVPLDLPPLRDRPEDLEDLFQGFLAAHFRGKARPQVTPGTLDILGAYHWPGNIRELRNLAEMLAATVTGERIEPADLPPRMVRRGESGAPPPPAEHLTIHELEKAHILRVYSACNEDKKIAAKRLGISLRTLYNKLAEYSSSGAMSR